MTINKDKRQRLNCAGIYRLPPAFPMASSMWQFSNPVLLTMSLLAITEVHRQCRENDRMMTSKVLYREMV